MKNQCGGKAYKWIDLDDLTLKIIKEYKSCSSIRGTARKVKISTSKVKRILLTNGVIHDDYFDAINTLYKAGRSVQEIMEELHLSKSYVSSHLPYTKGLYNAPHPTENALQIKTCRGKSAAKEDEDIPMPENKGQHLKWSDRLTIRRMITKGCHKQDIADAIGCCLATIYNEIHRGRDEDGNYNPQIAEHAYQAQLKKKGRTPKLICDPEQRIYLEWLMLDKLCSPHNAIKRMLSDADKDFIQPVKSHNTIYKAVREGLFDTLVLCDLPDKGRHKKVRRKKLKRKETAERKRSIEERPNEIMNRENFGHWEMDTVVGKSTNRRNLLVMTERKTRKEIIEVLPTHTAESVVQALNRIERRFGRHFYTIFKSITVDNGAEFQDNTGMEKALYRKGKRTRIYYCHPRSPNERGSNENQNKLIRRKFKKGSNFDSRKVLTRKKAKNCE